MKQIEGFLAARGDLEERPADVVRLAAGALLEISLLKGVRPARVKRGLPVFRHIVPTESYMHRLFVKPHINSALALSDPLERAVAAENPASLTRSHAIYSDVIFSFDLACGVVSVERSRDRYEPCGESSVNERGMNTIRNAWRGMHLPTIAYVEQFAEQLR